MTTILTLIPLFFDDSYSEEFDDLDADKNYKATNINTIDNKGNNTALHPMTHETLITV